MEALVGEAKGLPGRLCSMPLQFKKQRDTHTHINQPIKQKKALGN